MAFDLARFCLDHPGACLLPAEHLGEGGASAEVRAVLERKEGLSPGHLDLFDRGYRLYRRRAADLHGRAPGSWLPPRKAHVLLITDPDRVPSYSAPFLGASWCLHASDLDPSISHEEWVAYQIFHVERLSFLRSLRAAVAYNLSYFLVLTEDELAAFSRAAALATRPDARAFAALSGALPRIRGLHHLPLRPPPSPPPERMQHVDGADLLVPASLLPDLQRLLATFDAEARAMEATFAERQAAAPGGRAQAPSDELITYLRDERPDVLLVGPAGEVVYDPREPLLDEPARRSLAGLTHRAAGSLREDLRVVSAKSRAVLASLRDPDRLPRTSSDVEAGGGVYIHAGRRLVVYEVAQPGFDALRREAPPFHRKLLAARTVHEWGHLVHEAGILRVPPERRREHEEAVSALGGVLAAAVHAIPERLSGVVRAELSSLGADPASPGPALAKVALGRISDYTSNLFFRRYLDPEELRAYVLNNVRDHLNDGLGPIAQLTRHAAELQYLRLAGSADPLSHLLETSYFETYMIRSGVFTEAHLRAALDATARVCACHEIDTSAFAEAEAASGGPSGDG